MFASCCRGSNCSLVRSMDGRIALQHHWPTATSDDCKARLVRFRPSKTRYIRISGISLNFRILQCKTKEDLYWYLATTT